MQYKGRGAARGGAIAYLCEPHYFDWRAGGPEQLGYSLDKKAQPLGHQRLGFLFGRKNGQQAKGRA